MHHHQPTFINRCFCSIRLLRQVCNKQTSQSTRRISRLRLEERHQPRFLEKLRNRPAPEQCSCFRCPTHRSSSLHHRLPPPGPRRSDRILNDPEIVCGPTICAVELCRTDKPACRLEKTHAFVQLTNPELEPVVVRRSIECCLINPIGLSCDSICIKSQRSICKHQSLYVYQRICALPVAVIMFPFFDTFNCERATPKMRNPDLAAHRYCRSQMSERNGHFRLLD
jgi:hypothetical protein